MEQPKPFKLPRVEITSPADIALLLLRIKEGAKKMQTRWGGEDPKIVRIAMALMDKKYFYTLSNEFTEELNKLNGEAEALIDSPNANTPEVRARRKIVADQINIILDQQIQLPKTINISNVEGIIRGASSGDLDKANLLVEPLVSDLELIANPPAELN